MRPEDVVIGKEYIMANSAFTTLTQIGQKYNGSIVTIIRINNDYLCNSCLAQHAYEADVIHDIHRFVPCACCLHQITDPDQQSTIEQEIANVK